jgi:hypothetical protein
MRRTLVLALLFSVLLHLVVFAVPGLSIGNLFADEKALPIEARLVKTAKPLPLTKPRPRKPAPAAPKPPELVQNSEPAAVPAMPAEPDTPPQADADSVPPETEPEALAIPEVAPPLPRNGRIRYSILRGRSGFVIGQAIHDWRHDGKRYLLSAVTETTGIAAIFKPVKITQVSEGGFLQGELKPESFRFDRGGNDVVTASFDWKAQQVTLGDGQVVSIADGAEDFLSMFYQLMQAAQRGEGFEMAVATGRKVERYAFEWLGEDELNLKAGRFHAWHVRVHAVSGGKDITEVWLGKEVAGLPVMMRFTDRKGDVSEQIAEEITYEGK